MRIFAVSNLRMDFAENRRRLQQFPTTAYLRGAMVAAGSAANDLRAIDWMLRKMRSQFGKVFCVPGNHDLRGSGGECDSAEKFRPVLRPCDEIGNYTRSGRAGKNWIAPLFSWHESDYDRQGEADVSSL